MSVAQDGLLSSLGISEVGQKDASGLVTAFVLVPSANMQHAAQKGAHCSLSCKACRGFWLPLRSRSLLLPPNRKSKDEAQYIPHFPTDVSCPFCARAVRFCSAARGAAVIIQSEMEGIICLVTDTGL